MSLEDCKERLGEFFKLNTLPQIEEITVGKEKRLAITMPWGDESISILVDEDDADIFDALNNVYLPERFSALWHPNDKALEFIWTVFPTKSEARDRSFKFAFDGKEYECAFGPASDRLVKIGINARPQRSSKTNYRNLSQFSFLQSDEEWPQPLEARSFWVKPIEWDEDAVVHLAHHINFYMSYYDVSSPLILLHTPKSEEKAVTPRIRYIEGEFPKQIDGRVIDENLLHFWHASLSGDPTRRFLYNYRILEYASISYAESKKRDAVRRILANPTNSLRIDEVAQRVISTIQGHGPKDDIPRINMLLEATVDADLLWREIERNSEAFSSETSFDGGFKIPPLLNGKDKEGAFQTAWPVTFHNHLRSIRNHLSHGKDPKTELVIAPSASNNHLLQPWVAAISVVASQVVMYRGII